MRSEPAAAEARSSHDHRPLVVELVGTPGSGKTTLSRALVATLHERGVRAATIVEAARPRAGRTLAGRLVGRIAPGRLGDALLWRLFYVTGSVQAAAFAAERPALAKRVACSQRGRPISAAMKRHTLYWWAQLAGRYRFLTRGPRACDVLVLDDGFLHRSVALHASHLEDPDPSAVAAYVDLLPAPDLVIRTVADPEICERRVHDRGIWRHSRTLSPDKIARSLRSAERAVDLAVLRARERGWNVVEIDNGDRDLALVDRDLRDAVIPVIAPGPAGRHVEAVGQP